MLCSSAHSLVKSSVWVYCIGTDRSVAVAICCYKTTWRLIEQQAYLLLHWWIARIQWASRIVWHCKQQQTWPMTWQDTQQTCVWSSVIEHNKAGQNAISRMQSFYVKLPVVDKSNSVLSGCFALNNSIKITAKQVCKDHANMKNGKDHCINFKYAWQPYMLKHNAVLLCSLTCTCILVTAQGHRCTYIWVWVRVLSKPWFSFTQ